jgi:hypothetical protein
MTLLAACSSDTQSDEVRVLRVGVAQQDGDLVRRDYTDDYDLVRTNVEVRQWGDRRIEASTELYAGICAICRFDRSFVYLG